MSKHADPFERRKSFHAAPASAHSTQAIRRQLALQQQRQVSFSDTTRWLVCYKDSVKRELERVQRRTSAIEAARTAFRGLDDLEDLSLAGSSADEADSPLPTPLNDRKQQQPPRSEPTPSGDLLPSAVDSSAAATHPPPPLPNISKTKRKAFKPKYKAWAKNLLSYAETLDLRYGLPEGIDSEWRAVVVPKGKRCLCATASEQGGNNTILYSRVAGRALGRFSTALPADCLLDCVWDSHLNVLWVLDVCKWRSQYLVQCEAEMRAFFIASKLSELPTQTYAPPSSIDAASAPVQSGPRPLLVLPVPNLPPPLSPPTLLPLLSTLSTVPTPSLSISALVNHPPDNDTFDPNANAYEITLPLHPTGLLLYLSAAHYESGSTPLVSWVPCPTSSSSSAAAPATTAPVYQDEGGAALVEDHEAEGVRRFGELVQLWEREGAPRIAPSLPHVGVASPSLQSADDPDLPAAEVEMDG